jgi:hypothetical protein
MNTLASLTTIVSYFAMALSLWLGGYIITRSPRSRLAWQAGLTLWALTGFFVDVAFSINPSALNSWWIASLNNLTLAFWYHLSVQVLPPQLAQRQRWLVVFAYLQAVVLDVLVLVTPLIVTDVRQGMTVTVKAFELGPLAFLLPISLVGFGSLTLVNYWRARRAVTNRAMRKQLNSLVRGTLLAVLAVFYAMTAIVLRIPAPILPVVILLSLGVSLLGYGIVRYSALVDGRILRHDFVLSGALVLMLTALYLIILSAFFQPIGLPPVVTVVVIVLVIVTHTSFGFLRHLLDLPFLHRSGRALRATLRGAAREVSEREAVDQGLRNALSALLVRLRADWGAIALRGDADYTVQVSVNWKPIGEQLPSEPFDRSELTVVQPDASDQPLAIIAPLIVESASIGVILLGQPKGAVAYDEYDLDLIAETADRLSALLQRARLQEEHSHEIGQMLAEFREREHQLQNDIDELRSSARNHSIDLTQVTAVEDALRHLYDYSYLGQHALADNLLPDYRVATHLDRGKILNGALIAAIEKLRPDGTEPREIPPRQWQPYLVLRNAYVNGDANRDVMSLLYVSEATFHRTRRSALRAVTQVLFEMKHSATA